jgi:hypothetical protein
MAEMKDGLPLIQREKDLATIAAKDPALYPDVSLAALTVYSLFWLHQWQLRRTIEAVSILNWRLFPDKFGMVGWPNTQMHSEQIARYCKNSRNIGTG